MDKRKSECRSQFHYKNRTWCPERLIEEAIKEDFIRELALFCKLKRNLSHGWFRTGAEVARRTGITESTFYRHIDVLRDRGLILKAGDAFRLKTRKELEEEYGRRRCTIFIKPQQNNLTKITYDLQLKVVELHAKFQRKHIQELKLTDSSRSWKAIKRALKLYGDPATAKKQRLEKLKYPELLENEAFTYERIAIIIGSSKSQAWNLMQYAQNLGVCSLQVVQKTIKTCSYAQWQAEKHILLKSFSHAFWKSGKVLHNVFSIYKGKRYWEEGLADYTNTLKKKIRLKRKNLRIKKRDQSKKVQSLNLLFSNLSFNLYSNSIIYTLNLENQSKPLFHFGECV